MNRDIPDIGRGRIALKLLFLALLFGIVWLWRPLFHPVLYRMVYSPGGLLAIGLPMLVAVLLFLAPPAGDDSVETKITTLGFVLVIGVVLGLVVGGYTGLAEERTLAQQTMSEAENVEEFPEMEAENARVTPRAVSNVQTRASVSYRQHRLGPSDIARAPDGSLAWSYSIQPDGLRNSMYESQRGVLLSDMTRMEHRDIQAHDEEEYEIGLGMWWQPLTDHRGAKWNLKKQHFWTQYRDDPVEFVHENESYLYFPKTGHEWTTGSGIVPHTVPTWEGGALIHSDGTVEHLSKQESREHEALEGQRLYPLYNSERKVASLPYREGIWNNMVRHENEVHVADMPAGAGNSQPFVVDLAGQRMSYVMAMEPYGEDTNGLDEVWFTDSRTGNLSYYGTGDETLTGPERAMGLIRGADTRTDWDHGEDSGQFQVVEPVPVTVNDSLWWHAKVVPTDNTDVTRNSFVSTSDGEVLEFEDTERVYEFLQTGDEELANGTQQMDPGGENSTSTDSTVYVVIVGEDGEVERIPVEDSEEIRIEQS